MEVYDHIISYFHQRNIIFNECIDRFRGNPESLLAYIEKPEEKGKTAESVGLSQIITEKLTQLEKQMEACSQTIREIKELTKQS